MARAQAPAAINGRTNFEIILSLDVPGDCLYHPSAEAYPAEDIPRAMVKRFRDWSESTIYAGTKRDIWVSVPHSLDGPACLLVCQDGGGYVNREGPVRAAAVLDSLMHGGEIRPTVGVYVMPGMNADEPAQRSIEYDTTTDAYVDFIDQELLPFVEREVKIEISSEPGDRIACGISSGGICAFNMAWQRPESFGKVISHCGSFTNIRGGHEFPYWIRETQRKPIKVFMQSGSADADIPIGSWPIANQMTADALEFAGYDVRFEYGTGGHNLRHGGALFAEALRWLEGSESNSRTAADDERFLSENTARIKAIQVP
ncbi:MAG: alpha/beta hydrolase-fold protein [Pseudomonadales bacterium]